MTKLFLQKPQKIRLIAMSLEKPSRIFFETRRSALSTRFYMVVQCPLCEVLTKNFDVVFMY
jgi:hypothetical protein